MNNNAENTKGIIGTVVFHAIVLVLLFIFGFHQEETKQEDGIQINFGTSSTGKGAAEPQPSKRTPKPTPTPITPKARTTPSTPKIKTTSTPSVATQEFEESLEMKRKKDEAKKQNQEEQKKQQQAEQEEQARKIKQAEQDRQAAQIRAQTGNAFATSGQGTAPTSGEGNNQNSGNAGSTQGGSSGSPYGTGTGKSGFSLNGRSLVGALPTPRKEFQEEGYVVVEIEVDRSGNVTHATPTLKGSTTQNVQLWKLAKEAALKAKFNNKSDAAAFQKGTITYHFTLN